MKAILNNDNMEKATKSQHKLAPITKETKKSLLMLIIDIDSKHLEKEKRALMDIACEQKEHLTIKQADKLKEYVKESEEITGLNKRKYLDTISLLSYGYVVR